MCSNNEMLDREKIKKALDRDIEIYLYSLIDSTNTEAKRLAEGGTSGRALILAEEQSGGRGRMGRSFYSPRGVGLYMTLLFPSPNETDATLRITSIAAVALKRSIYRVYGIETKIKWVNDIYLDGSKAAGILAESFMGEKEGKSFKAVAVGIGVNISTESFPDELRKIAVSLGKLGGRSELAAEITNEFFTLLDKAGERDFSYMNEYRESSLCLGREIRFTENGYTETGVVESIDDMGFLHVALGNGKSKILSSGEISVRFENKGK
ncbi:MAG: biotin--[acetyl-CoA-carboxylase] ligase [Clostridia bacterium]|nr:biotin--[acetyl-CoA-carboxylase] ligase [Clostridia bacterium]